LVSGSIVIVFVDVLFAPYCMARFRPYISHRSKAELIVMGVTFFQRWIYFIYEGHLAIARIDGVFAEETKKLSGISFYLRRQFCESKRARRFKEKGNQMYGHPYIDCIIDDYNDYSPPELV